MKILDFKKEISEISVTDHTVTINKENWVDKIAESDINYLFDADEIEISRKDLYAINDDFESLIIKTYMWGFPQGGRGRHVKDIIGGAKIIAKQLAKIEDKKITMKFIEKSMAKCRGLGLSTFTKILNFMDVQMNGYKVLILENQIVSVITEGIFEELNIIMPEFTAPKPAETDPNAKLRKITPKYIQFAYPKYIKKLDELAKEMNVTPEQIELILFTYEVPNQD